MIAAARSRSAKILDVVGFVALLAIVALFLAPIFTHRDTYGSHDWDQMEAHRYLAVKTLTNYHQIPLWNPYSCGGHTWWGGVESGTNLVSPFLPAYLLAPLPMALRIEIAGATTLGAVGAWVFGGRLLESTGLRLLVSVAFALNTRYALGVEMGHAWHLYYALVPWALFFLDRAISAAKGKATGSVVGLGAVLAGMVYLGAIYPMPQAIMVVAIYALTGAVALRSFRPLALAVLGGVVSFGLAAPKLLPILETLRRFPRLVDSPETIDLNGVVGIFTTRSGDPRPAVGPWAWHEFGIYVGWIPFILMCAAPFLARRWRERAALFAGAGCFVLALGRFSSIAPWALLHDHVPVFQSQHVPSRWFYPMVLMLSVAAAAGLQRLLHRHGGKRFSLEIALLAVALWVGIDIALESQKELVNAFPHPGPSVAVSTGPFHQERVATGELRYAGADWTAPALPAMMANVGLIDCGTFPGLHSYYRDRKGAVPGLGAKGLGDPDYRGEVFFIDGDGTATMETWTPNAVSVRWEGAKSGDVLVMNQNWDAGWSAEGRVENLHDRLAVRVDAPSGMMHFRYRPRFMVLGLVIFALTLVGIALQSERVRRRIFVKATG